MEDNVDAGELIRGLVDVRGRLDKIRKGTEGRGRLVGVVLGEETSKEEEEEEEEGAKKVKDKTDDVPGKPTVRNFVEMDRRVGELEKLVGSSSTSLDEVFKLLIVCTMAESDDHFHDRHLLCHHPFFR